MSLAYLEQESTSVLPDHIWNVAWSSSNKIISASADGHLRIWDADELTKPVYDISSHPLAISSLSINKNGHHALAASLDGTIVLVDCENGIELGRVDTGREEIIDGGHKIPAFSCALHPQSTCFAWSGRSSKIGFSTIPGGDTLTELGNNGNNTGRGVFTRESKAIESSKGKFGMDLQFSPDGRSLALSTEQGQVVIVDVESQAVVATYSSHNKAVRTISWSPDSQWLFSGADDNLIVLYDVRAGSQSDTGGKGEGAVAVMQGHQSWVLKVAASPDSKLLGSGGADKVIKLWDIGQRSCVSTSAANAEVWSFAWQPEGATSLAPGKQFAVAGDDNIVTLYRAAGAA
ncbi:hypothetical protein L204_101126 [Cryptococcus depauperatus]